MERVTIKYQGLEVDCFGSLEEDANLLVGFTDCTEGVFENWIADEERPAHNWTEMVKDIVSVQGYKNINQIEAV
tara:strand:+ start:16 stop:237 length:222 start_codon:yes stop_codon:yes gene_type:complete